MFHIKYRVNGEVHSRRLARRHTYNSGLLIEQRHDWRRQALDHYRGVNTSRVTPQLEDILEVSLYDGVTLLQRIPFTEPT